MEHAELTIHVNDVRYSLLRYGDTGSGLPSLFYLHGFGGCAANFEYFAPKLNRTVYAIDLLGHGKSDSPASIERYSLDKQLNDLLAIITALSDSDTSPHLLGYSMGGRLAMRLAFAYPTLFSSIIIESSSPGIVSPAERKTRVWKDRELASKIRHDMPSFFAAWNRLPLFASAEDAPSHMMKAFEKRQLLNNPEGLANNLEGFGAGTLIPVHDELGKLPIPMCIITGEKDEKYTSLWKDICASWPVNPQVVIPGAGHRVHLDRPDTYIEHINHFLNLAESSL